jgi:hypothetical protein
VFERFTDRARRVVVLAQEEARLLNHNYIGTEHVLLGLIREGEGVGAKALESQAISLGGVRSQVEQIIGQGGSAPSGHIPFTARAKKVLELSLREALQLGHNYIGTEHILLGLIREGEGVAAQVLVKLGADLSRTRQAVLHLLSGPGQNLRDPPATALGVIPPIQAAAAAVCCSFCGRDLWEVDRHVASPGAAICSDCIVASQDALDRAAESTWGPVHLPPRVFGAEPTDPGAVAAIEHAFHTVFSDASTDEERAEALEDGTGLLPSLAEARERAPAIGPVRVQIQRVRFLDEHHARVGFTILLGGAGGPSLDGQALETGGVWRVSRETFCRVVAMAGVRCPPQTTQAD